MQNRFFFFKSENTSSKPVHRIMFSKLKNNNWGVYLSKKKSVTRTPPPPPCRQVPPNFDHILLGKTVISL